MYCKWIGWVWFDRLRSSRFFVGYYYKMDCVVVVGFGDGAVVLVIVELMSNIWSTKYAMNWAGNLCQNGL